ncbi:MAG: hypothetical protein CL945_00220 [Dinoroseobacter sp.]|jgi:exonuclease III|nr:hypothetical protein [Dinoroseobacter sp.]
MRIVTWNCRRATAKSELWDYLLALAPDVAVLQEVSGLPDEITSSFSVERMTPITKDGRQQRFTNVVLAKGEISEARPLTSQVSWIDEQLCRFAGNLTQMTVSLPGTQPIEVVSVYSPAWPLDREVWSPEDVTDIKLDLNPDLWVADLLHAALKERAPTSADRLVLAGDFNLCESFDLWRKPRGNLEYLTRLASLGLVDALRRSQGAMTPTFKGPRHSAVANQLDYLFVTQAMSAKLLSCEVGAIEDVIGKLSDHLPVVAEFS